MSTTITKTTATEEQRATWRIRIREVLQHAFRSVEALNEEPWEDHSEQDHHQWWLFQIDFDGLPYRDMDLGDRIVGIVRRDGGGSYVYYNGESCFADMTNKHDTLEACLDEARESVQRDDWIEPILHDIVKQIEEHVNE